MVSGRSCGDLFDLGENGVSDFDDAFEKPPLGEGTFSDSLGDEEITRKRQIIAGNCLPLRSRREPETGKWSFAWDEDSILFQMKDSFCSSTEVIYVGNLDVDIDVPEQEAIGKMLRQEYRCMPTFLSPDIRDQYYHGFCKQYLWPIFHYMLPMSPDLRSRFDRSLYLVYVAANQRFAHKIIQAMSSDNDSIWIHDYHLMLVPTFIRKHINRARIGFFLHSPFPSSEIYRTLPVREDILMSLLNSDLVGFQTFDYARHFLSCCRRMLGLDHQSKRGYVDLEYLGRMVSIKILPVGIHVGRLRSVLNFPSTAAKLADIKLKYGKYKLLLGIDDMDIFKGISLKLLAFELLLERSPKLRGEVVLVQVANPPRTSGSDILEEKNEVVSIAERINHQHGFPGYEPVVLINDPIPYHEKCAFYAAAECCIVNAVRDGMNLVPYEYVVCRQGNVELDEEEEPVAYSSLVVSEFIGCSPSLSGAVRVNPWNVEQVSEALKSAVRMPAAEKRLRHEKHYSYVTFHHVGYWASSFARDLQRACKDHCNKMFWGIGFGTRFRVVALSPNLRRLSIDYAVSAYRRTQRRAIFLDYDGTLMPESSMNKIPSAEIVSVLNSLCSDPNNTVFIISGRDQKSLSEWFSQCEKLGIAAEHGCFLRWNRDSEWESADITPTDLNWKETVRHVMTSYTEATDGSYIESKRSGLVWHHYDADPDFGSCQAKELVSHLDSVLASEPAVVTRGQHIVEVKPRGVGKGLAVEKVLKELVGSGSRQPEFLMCIGDDNSDEDMFEYIIGHADAVVSGEEEALEFGSVPRPKVFACTVGKKPSKARYYVDDATEVISMLKCISSCCQKLKETRAVLTGG